CSFARNRRALQGSFRVPLPPPVRSQQGATGSASAFTAPASGSDSRSPPAAPRHLSSEPQRRAASIHCRSPLCETTCVVHRPGCVGAPAPHPHPFVVRPGGLSTPDFTI